MFIRVLFILVAGFSAFQPLDAQAESARILFSVSGDLYTINADGSSQHPLTDGDCYDTPVQLSPDGTQAAFRAVNCPDSGLKIFDLASGEVRQIADTADSLNSLLSPDWTKVAWIEARPGNTNRYSTRFFDVYMRDLDTTESVQVGGGLHSYFPLNWSPDGTRLLYETMNTDGTDIMVVDLERDTTTPLDDDTGFDNAAAWSPDGETLALISRRNGEDASFLYLVDQNLDMAAARMVKEASAVGMAWSPDGTQLALVDFTGWNETLRISLLAVSILDLSSGEMRPVAPRDENGFNPSWSPDGGHLVYTSNQLLDANTGVFREVLWRVDVEQNTREILFECEKCQLYAPLIWLP